jgi:hypothetical protein
MLARTLRFWHDAGNLQTALRWKNFRRHKWLVFAGIVADHWRMDRHSVMVAARPRPVRRFARQRRLHRRHLVRLSRGLLHKHLLLHLKRRRPLVRNPATPSSKFC